MSNSLIAEKVWVVRQSGHECDDNLLPDRYVATLHRVIDFGFLGEPIWNHEPLEKYSIESSMELEKFSQLSVYPVTIIYS